MQKRICCNTFENEYHKSDCSGLLEAVDHPEHYGGDTPYEVIKVIHEWGLDKDFDLGNTVKYIARAGKKGDKLEDLKKAQFYLNYRIELLEGKRER